MSSTGSEQGGAGVVASVVSADGTAVGYRTRGRGPGVVVLHGGLESSASYTDLAGALAGSLTVHVVDRRGRGRSGPQGDEHGLATEVADVRAVVAATGARRLFGVSSGGVIALAAALELPTIAQVAVYEPALSVPGADPGAEQYIQRYEDALAQNDTAGAVLAILKGTRMGPRWLRLLPAPLARVLLLRLLAEDEADDGAPSFGALVPTMRYDFRIADEGSADLQRFAKLDRQVLLLGGDRSPGYLEVALTELEGLLPDHRRRRLRGVGHTASGNRRDGGRPDLVAAALLDFFAGEGRP